MKTRMRDGSGDRHYRFVYEDVNRHGTIRVYYWRGKGTLRTRISAQPGTPEFDREYQLLFNAPPKVTANAVTTGGSAAPGSLSLLCQLYYAGSAFRALGIETQKTRRRILERICERAGHRPYRLMEPRDVAHMRDAKAATPESANSIVKALRQLFKWACHPENAYASNNPASTVGFLKPENPDGHRPWTEADVEKYQKYHPIGTPARLALDLFLYTGARISDVAKFGPQMEQVIDGDEFLVFTETKGARRRIKRHSLPILPALRISIDATATGHLVYLPTMHGAPYAIKGFGNWFKRQCFLAGMAADLSAHGLRKLAAERCVEAGATEHQLRALFGWETGKQADLYTRRANRTKMESEAAPLLGRRKKG